VVPLVVGLPGKIVNSLVLVNKTVTTALLGLMQENLFMKYRMMELPMPT
jgi:hypothetical protein